VSQKQVKIQIINNQSLDFVKPSVMMNSVLLLQKLKKGASSLPTSAADDSLCEHHSDFHARKRKSAAFLLKI